MKYSYLYNPKGFQFVSPMLRENPVIKRSRDVDVSLNRLKTIYVVFAHEMYKHAFEFIATPNKTVHGIYLPE